MRCARVRKTIVLASREERSPRLHEEIEEHLAVCRECARFAQQMDVLLDSLHTLTEAPAPDRFAATVKRRLEVTQRKSHVGWLERIFGSQRAPAPAVPKMAWSAASLALAALAVGLLVTWPTANQPPASGIATVAHHASSEESALPIMDEILLRHRSYSRSLELTDEPGTNLISYSLAHPEE